jgi:hypothetical protein
MVQAAFDAVPANRRDAWRVHKLDGEDTFASLAKRYSTPATLVSSVNHDTLPEAGSLVVIPAAYPGDRVPVRTVVRARATPGTSSRKVTAGSSRVKPATRAAVARAKSPAKASAAAPAKTPTKASASKGTARRAG